MLGEEASRIHSVGRTDNRLHHATGRLTKATAKELSSRGITVNAVAPGFIATEMTDKLSDAVKEEACKTIPLGAFGTVEDVAEAVVFLASDRAKYITGQVLCVDGGIAM